MPVIYYTVVFNNKIFYDIYLIFTHWALCRRAPLEKPWLKQTSTCHRWSSNTGDIPKTKIIKIKIIIIISIGFTYRSPAGFYAITDLFLPRSGCHIHLVFILVYIICMMTGRRWGRWRRRGTTSRRTSPTSGTCSSSSSSIL